MSLEDVRAAFERWHAAASAGVDLLTAVHEVFAPDCIVHLQNGEDGGVAESTAQSAQAWAMWPDLSIEIDRVVTTDDRMLVQVTLTGTPSLVFRIARGRRTFAAEAAVVAKVSDRREITEIWAYLNPGAMLTFPPASHPTPPPIPDGMPGNESDASAVLTDWERASTGAEFLDRIIASASSHCLVHATNTDLGGIDLVESQFHVVQAAFPDLRVEFEDGFVIGDRLVCQFQFDGTQRGWLGIAPPSGSRVQSRGAIVARVNLERRVEEAWLYLAPGMGLIFPRTDAERR